MIKLQGPSRIIQKDETVILIRRCKGATKYVDGKPVEPKPETFDVRANIQPMSGRDLLLVPEGDRSKDQLWMFTQCRVELNDIVQRCDGKKYQVQTVQAWGSFNQARLMGLDVGPDASR